MNQRWRTISLCLLLVPVGLLSTRVAVICLEISGTLVRPSLILAADLHIRVAPGLVISFTDWAGMFLILLAWLLPVFWLAAYAFRVKPLVCLRWGFFISLLLFACLFWFLSSQNLQAPARIGVVVAVALSLFERFSTVRQRLTQKAGVSLQVAASVIPFMPLGFQLIYAPRLPPEPSKVWSISLQKGTWQQMNTGSGFDATRQVVFAGDRIVAAFDSSSAPYEGNQPMERYKIVSIDKGTGVVKNQMEMVLRWGSMPNLFATGDGHVVLSAGNVERLNPDLTTAGNPFLFDHGRVNTISSDGTTLAWETDPGVTLLDASTLKPIVALQESVPASISRTAVISGNHSWPQDYPNDQAFITRTDVNGSKLIFHSECGGGPHFLSADRILSVGCGWIRIISADGTPIITRRN